MAELNAIGLASNILNFLEVALALFLKAREIHRSTSGLTTEYEDIMADAERLKTLAKHIRDRRSRHAAPSIDSSLDEVVSACETRATLLIEMIKALRCGGQGRCWDSFAKALWGQLRKRDIEGEQTKLERLRRELMLYLMVTGHKHSFPGMVHGLKTRTTAQLDAVQLLVRRALSSDRTALGGEMTRLMKQLDPADDARSKNRGVLYTLCFSRLRRWHMSLPHFDKTLDGHGMSAAKRARFVQWLERRNGLIWMQSLASEGSPRPTPTWKTHVAAAHRLIKGADGSGSPTAIVRDVVSRAVKGSPELARAVAGSDWTMVDPAASSESLGDAEMVVILVFSRGALSRDDAAQSAKR